MPPGCKLSNLPHRHSSSRAHSHTRKHTQDHRTAPTREVSARRTAGVQPRRSLPQNGAAQTAPSEVLRPCRPDSRTHLFPVKTPHTNPGNSAAAADSGSRCRRRLTAACWARPPHWVLPPAPRDAPGRGKGQEPGPAPPSASPWSKPLGDQPGPPARLAGLCIPLLALSVASVLASLRRPKSTPTTHNLCSICP